jgi:Ala-tRNA(Pro) deacylase
LASVERLKDQLGIEPGPVSLTTLVNDPEHRGEVLIDRDIWQSEAVHCHPLVNPATLVIPFAGFRKFLAATGHTVQVVDIVSSPWPNMKVRPEPDLPPVCR